MNYILFDGTVRTALLPFTYTRPVADIRIGILTIREKWEKYLGSPTSTLTEDYLSEKFSMVEMEENILISASFLPDSSLVGLILGLKTEEAIFYKDEVIAYYKKGVDKEVDLSSYRPIEYEGPIFRIKNTWDIFSKNAEALQ